VNNGKPHLAAGSDGSRFIHYKKAQRLLKHDQMQEGAKVGKAGLQDQMQ